MVSSNGDSAALARLEAKLEYLEERLNRMEVEIQRKVEHVEAAFKAELASVKATVGKLDSFANYGRVAGTMFLALGFFIGTMLSWGGSIKNLLRP